MSDHSQHRGALRPAKTVQTGTAAVEFAIVIIVFLMLLFGIMELARSMYIFNTLQEVTRRGAVAAANTDFTDVAAKNLVRQKAIFRDSPGTLVFGHPVTDAHIRIEYMALVSNGAGNITPTVIQAGALPASPAQNRLICMGNPNDPACVRLVRVQVCVPDVSDECERVEYKTVFPLISFPVSLPRATTIVSAETLGLVPASTP